MANTGLVNIDISKTLDITSNNDINIVTNFGDVTVEAGTSNSQVVLGANGVLSITSANSITIEAPRVSINGDQLILTGQTESLGNTLGVYESRLSVLEANVYTPSNTGNLVTRSAFLEFANVYANSTAAMGVSIANLESVVYNPNTGLEATRASFVQITNTLASQTDALATSITNLQAISGVGNKTYVQPDEPTLLTTPGMLGGDLWFDSNDGYKLYRRSDDNTSWVNVRDTGIAGSVALINSEAAVRANADSAMTTTINGAISRIANSEARITSVEQTIVSTNTALSSRINQVAASVANVTALINNETLARINSDEALAETINNIIVTSGASGVKTYVRAGPVGPFGAGIGDLWFDTNDNWRMYRWSGTSWEAVDDRRIAGVQALITNEQQARITRDEALATQITGLNSRVGNNEATITTTQQTFANQISSLATQVQNLQVTAGSNTGAITYVQSTAPAGAKVGDLWFQSSNNYTLWRYTYEPAPVNANNWLWVADRRYDGTLASIQSQQIALANADAAMTLTINGALTRLSNAEAKISTIENTYVTNNAATASRVDALTASVYGGLTFRQATQPSAPPAVNGAIWYDTSNNNLPRRYNGSTWEPISDGRVPGVQAEIRTVANTVANLSTAFASLASNVSAQLLDSTAFNSRVESAVANSTSALANSVSILSSRVSNTEATVRTTSNTVAQLVGNVAVLTSQASLVVEAGRVAGFKATANSSTSEFIIQADKFKIQSGTGAGTQTPFSVINGVTYINNAVIGSNAITTEKIVPSSVTQSYSTVVTGGTVARQYFTTSSYGPPTTIGVLPIDLTQAEFGSYIQLDCNLQVTIKDIYGTPTATYGASMWFEDDRGYRWDYCNWSFPHLYNAFYGLDHDNSLSMARSSIVASNNIGRVWPLYVKCSYWAGLPRPSAFIDFGQATIRATVLKR